MENIPETDQKPQAPPVPSSLNSDHALSPRLSLRPVYAALILIFGILLGIGGLLGYQEFFSSPAVSTYEECVKARGSKIQESFPPTCITRDGKRFTQPTVDDGVNPIYTDPLSCNIDRDCTTGIQITTGCCVCPEPVNTSQIGKDGWESYVPGSDYSQKTACESLVACKPCEMPSQPVCRDNQCVFDTGQTVPSAPRQGFTCPKTEWVDCMPGPNEAGIRFECTDEFLSWAKANCPNFKGAAL